MNNFEISRQQQIFLLQNFYSTNIVVGLLTYIQVAR